MKLLKLICLAILKKLATWSYSVDFSSMQLMRISYLQLIYIALESLLLN